MLNRKSSILILVLSVLALVSMAQLGRDAFQVVRAQAKQPPPERRQKWEYCTVMTITPGSAGWKAQIARGVSIETVDSDMTGLSTVNRLGVEGWELVSVVHQTGNSAEYFLKRPLFR